MRDQRDLMIEKQKHRISRLNEDIERLSRRVNELMGCKAGHDFYMLIQNACEKNEVVADEFARFLTICRLSDPEEDGTPGLTAPTKDSQYNIPYGDYLL